MMGLGLIVNDQVVFVHGKKRLGRVVAIHTAPVKQYLLKCDADGYVDPNGAETIWFYNPHFRFPRCAVEQELVIESADLPTIEVIMSDDVHVLIPQRELQYIKLVA